MNIISKTTYKNSDRAKVAKLLDSMNPTEEEARELASIFDKRSISFRDVRLMIEFASKSTNN